MVQQIKFVAKERGIPEGSIVEAALREYLGKTEHEEILLKKSDKISRQIERFRREQRTLMEVLSSFIRVYLTHAQDIPDSERSNADLRGARKFARFMELVAKTLDESKPFFDELEAKCFNKEDFAQ